MQYYRDGTEQLVQKLVSSFVVGVEIAVSEKKTSPYDVYASEQAHIFWFPVRAMEEEGVLDLRESCLLYTSHRSFTMCAVLFPMHLAYQNPRSVRLNRGSVVDLGQNRRR